MAPRAPRYRVAPQFSVADLRKGAPRLTAPGQPFGVSDFSLRLAAAAAAEEQLAPRTRTSILTTFLTSTADVHGGAFSYHMFTFNKTARILCGRGDRRHCAAPPSAANSNDTVLGRLVKDFLRKSPGMCAIRATLHVIHDLDVPGSPPGEPGLVVYHRAPTPPLVDPPDVRRWLLYDELLPQIAGDCVYAIDLTDVAVFRLPPCAALPLHQLLVAPDGSSKNWLHKQARRTWLGNTSVPSYHQFLDGQTDDVVFNCGVVGGPREIFAARLRALCARLSAHWHPPPPAIRPPIIAGSDMVAWNELLRNESEILPGYPWGPAALPMYGGLARSHPDHLHPSRPCTGRCRHEWLNLTVGLYWFGHKAPPSWERHHVPRAPACDLRT